MFDNLGWGLNQRLQDVGEALDSAEKSYEWINMWWDNLIEALDLPEKFFMSAHSLGGTQAMLYVSRHPERCEGLFLQSPACTEDQSDPNWVHDPYSYRIQDIYDSLPPHCLVNRGIDSLKKDQHIFYGSGLVCLPLCMVKMAVSSVFKRYMKPKFFTESLIQAAIHYWALQTRNPGKQDVIMMKMCLPFTFLKEEFQLFKKDKMLQDFDFPIAFSFGTRDFFGSAEGAQRIVRNNRHFQTGRS